MKRLKLNLKLTQPNKVELEDRAMKDIKGCAVCGCICACNAYSNSPLYLEN